MELRCKKILMWLGFLALLLGVGTAWGQTPYPYSQPPRVKVVVKFYGDNTEYSSARESSTARQAVQEVLGSHSGKSVKDIEVLTIDNDNIKAPKGSELQIEDWYYLANMKMTLRELYVEPGMHFKDPMPKDQFRGAFRLERLELCGVEEIGATAITDCQSLAWVTCIDLKTLTKDAITDNPVLVGVRFPKLKTVADGALSGNPNLAYMELGAEAPTGDIGNDRAFRGLPRPRVIRLVKHNGRRICVPLAGGELTKAASNYSTQGDSYEDGTFWHGWIVDKTKEMKDVTVPTSIAHGRIIAPPAGLPGKPVHFAVLPEKGYTIKTLKQNSKDIGLSAEHFTMGSGATTITGTFAPNQIKLKLTYTVGASVEVGGKTLEEIFAGTSRSNIEKFELLGGSLERWDWWWMYSGNTFKGGAQQSDPIYTLREFKIAKGITRVAPPTYQLFYTYSALREVDVYGVRQIMRGTFQQTPALETLRLWDVESLGEGAILEDHNLRLLVAPRLQVVNRWIRYCSALRSIYLGKEPLKYVFNSLFEENDPTRHCILLVDNEGKPLSGTELTNAQNAYQKHRSTSYSEYFGWAFKDVYQVTRKPSEFGSMASVDCCQKDKFVDLEVMPNDGYRVKKLEYVGGGKTENLTKNLYNEKCSFKMPGAHVTVQAEYEPNDMVATITLINGQQETHRGTNLENVLRRVLNSEVAGIEVTAGAFNKYDWDYITSQKQLFGSVLKELKIGSDVKPVYDIPNMCLAGFTALARVDLHNVYHVGTGAFLGCSNLEEAKLWKATELGRNAFSNCDKLKELTLPKLRSLQGSITNDKSLMLLRAPATPPDLTGIESIEFQGLTTEPHYLIPVDGDGAPLKDAAYTKAIQEYAKKEKDGKWYGWTYKNTYQITKEEGENVSISVPSAAVKGTPVKVTSTLAKGYKLGKLVWLEKKTPAGSETTITGGQFTMPAANVLVKATAKPIQYKVHFELNGGTGTMQDQTIEYGKPTKLQKCTFVNAGKEFMGWGKSANGEVVFKDQQVVTNLSDQDNAVVKLYARWESSNVQRYKVSYFSLEERGTIELKDKDNKPWPNGSRAVKGTKLTWTIKAKPGYKATGVKKNGTSLTGASGEITVDNEDIELVAIFDPIHYKVKFVGGAGTTGSMPDQTFTYGQEGQSLNECKFKKASSRFLGWSKKSDAKVAEYYDRQPVSTLSTTANATVTLYAVWVGADAKTYPVNYLEPKGGSLKVTAEGETVGAGTEVLAGTSLSIEAKPDAGYTLASLLVNGQQHTSGDSHVVRSETTIAAEFRGIFYTVVFHNGIPGKADETREQTFNYGERKTLKKCPFTYDGYSSIGWASAEDRNTKLYDEQQVVGDLATKAGEEIHLYPIWRAGYSISWLPNQNGRLIVTEVATNKKLESGSLLAPNTTVKIETEAKEGYIKSKLLVNGGSHADGAQYKVTGPTNIEYDFIAKEYTVVYKPNNVDAKGTMPSQTFKVDAPAKLAKNTFTLDKRIFLGWSKTIDGRIIFPDEYEGRNLGGVGEEVILYAIWKNAPLMKYMVSWQNPAHGTLKVEAYGKPVTSGSSLQEHWEITVNAVPDAGYKLKSLKVKANAKTEDLESGAAFTLLGNTELVAEFEKQNPLDPDGTGFQVNFAQPDHGLLLVQAVETGIYVEAGQTVKANTKLKVTALPKEAGYEFEKLTANGSAISNEGTHTVTAAVTFAATFKASSAPNPLDPDGDGHQVNIPQPTNGFLLVKAVDKNIYVANGQKVKAGIKLRVVASPAAGYELEHLTANGADVPNDSEYTMPNEEVAFAATFKASAAPQPNPLDPDGNGFRVDYAQPEHGILLVEAVEKNLYVSPGQSVAANTKLRVTVVPSKDYEVETLTVGGEAIESGATFELKKAVEIVAKLKESANPTPNPFDPDGTGHTVAYEQAVGGILLVKVGDAVVNNGLTVKDGQKVMIEATPYLGYKLVSLTVNGENVTNKQEYTVTGNIVVVATFRSIEPNPRPNPFDPDGTGYLVTYDQPEHGVLLVMVDGKVVTSGTTVAPGYTLLISSRPDAGYEFDQQTVNGDVLPNDTEIRLQSPITVRAAFKKQEQPLVVEALRLARIVENPFSNELRVVGAERVERYELFDMGGKLVMQGQHTGNAELVLDTQNLAAGGYLLRLYAAGGTRTLRAIRR
ncbi:MAG: InlB B-repeat-containing protein [Bacteroides sp.]